MIATRLARGCGSILHRAAQINHHAGLRSSVAAHAALPNKATTDFSFHDSRRTMATRVGFHRKPKIPMNTVINFVPQQQAWVVERMGKFHAVLEPGLQILLPIIDEIKYVHSLKEIVIEIPAQSAITQDNVTLNLDGVLYLKIVDPYKASYGVEDAEYAMSQLAQTTMRSELGKLTLDTVFKERAQLNTFIVDSINDAARPWGVTCLRCEIRDIQLPTKVIDDMQLQVSAERKKRANILESEGVKIARINEAEGAKQSQILRSEAFQTEKANHALGEAKAMKVKAEAQAEALSLIAGAIRQPGGSDAVSLDIAKQYVNAFGNLAQDSTTLMLPSNAGDPASMVAQAMGVYGKIQESSKKSGKPEVSEGGKEVKAD